MTHTDYSSVVEIQDLEERYGPALAQFIFDQLNKTQNMEATSSSGYAKAA